MKKLIHKYLSGNYILIPPTPRVPVDKHNTFKVCKKSNNEITSPSSLSTELVFLFAVDETKIKWYVKSWVGKKYGGLTFLRWWNPRHFRQKSKIFKWKDLYSGNIGYPIIRAQSKWVAQELVEVQPMEFPQGLQYIIGVDLVYRNEEPVIFKRERDLTDTMGYAFQLLKERQDREIFG